MNATALDEGTPSRMAMNAKAVQGLARPPAQAISTRSVAARCQASGNAGRTSARSAGRRKSGQRSHRDSQGTSGCGWPSRYTPKAGAGPSGSGGLRPRPRTSLPEGSRKIPGAEASQNSPTAGWYFPSRAQIAGRLAGTANWEPAGRSAPRRALAVTARFRPSRKDPGAAVAPTAYIPGWDGPGNGARLGSRRRRRRPGNPSHAAALRPVGDADRLLSVRQELGFFLLRCCSFLHSEISRVAGFPALPQQHEVAAPTKQASEGTTRLA